MRLENVVKNLKCWINCLEEWLGIIVKVLMIDDIRLELLRLWRVSYWGRRKGKERRVL